MKWLLRIFGAFVLLVIVFLAVGFLLPAQFKVQRSTTIAAPAETVYGLIADPREWKKWTVWNQRDPNMKVEYSGAPSGAGAKWSWQSKTEGNGAMEFTSAKPSESISYSLSFPDFNMQSQGLLVVEPADKGVRVTWSNEGDISANPINRWFGFFMDKMIGPDFEAGLANLKKLAEGS